MRLDRVVIATDFSPSSISAARWAAEHLVQGAELVLAHVIPAPHVPGYLRGRFPPTDESIETARQGADMRLREVARSIAAPHVRTEIRVGNVAEQIASLAGSWNADLIVVGRHHDQGDIFARVGSTAEAIVRSGVAPVLLGTGLPGVGPRHILVALDDSDEATTMIAWAQLLASRSHARVTALHVVPSAILGHVLALTPVAALHGGDAEAETRDDIRRSGDRWIESLVHGGLDRDRVTSEVAFGEPGQEILAAAARENAELIVVGTQNRTGARRWLLGSIASEVLRGAVTCPVLVVPPPIDEILD